MDEELLTQKQVCEILKVGMMTLYRWRKEGRIEAIYPNGPHRAGAGGFNVRVKRSEVERFIREMTKESQNDELIKEAESE